MTTCWEIAVHLAVADDVFGDVFFAVPFPMRFLDEILDLTESVSEGFLTYLNQKVVSLHNGFMTQLCNNKCEMGYFL